MSIREVIPEFKGQYRFLSNFYPAKVNLDGIEFPSVENAYQAAKNFNIERRKMFVGLTAGQAKKEGRKTVIRPDWEQVKISIMTTLVGDKFRNNLDLRQKLLDTNDAELIEGNNWNDCFWGICKGRGENHLGKILMKVRGELQSES